MEIIARKEIKKMKKQIKTIALITTGLVVGVVVARNEKRINKIEDKIFDLEEYERFLTQIIQK